MMCRILGVILCMLTVATTQVAAQGLDALRNEIRKAEQEIALSNELLSKTQKDKRNTDQQVKLLQNKIRNRKSIISNLEQQSALIGGTIQQKNDTIQRLHTNLTQLRKSYGELIYDAYKNYRLNNFMLFLFASRDFNDATLRIAYMRRYNRLRERKAAEIDSLSGTLHQRVSALQSQRQELEQVRQSRNSELSSLSKDETQFRTTAAQLGKEASKLSSTIRTKKQKIDKLQQQIRQIIAEESRKNNSKPQTTAQREQNIKLSGEFDQNMGRLPYPVRGVVVDRYGTHADPNNRSVLINNNGVNIAAPKGADVKAVYAGEVRQVVFHQFTSNVVIIQHGNYLSVYSNLSSIRVKVGDHVSTNQSLGSLGSGDEADGVLHFEIWRMNGAGEPTNLNPEKWLRR